MSTATLPAPAAPPPPRHDSAALQDQTAVRGPGGLLAFLRRPLGALLVLLAAVFAVYLPTLNGQFLYDDTKLVTTTQLIRSPLFCLEVFRHTLFNDESNFYRPTQTLVFMADYWCWELNPFGYHLTSILLQAANAFLLCLVLRLVLPAILRGALDQSRLHLLALGIALVWAVHPVHSAAVAYVSGTADPLAMACCLTAVLLCERALRARTLLPRSWYGAGAFLGLLLGLCAKEIASVWLLLFLGYLFLGRAGTSRRTCWIVVAGAAAALVAYAGLRCLPPPHLPPPFMPKLPPKGVLMLRALGDYGSMLLFPKDLFMERQVFAAPGLANSQDEWFYHTLFFNGVLVLLVFAFGAWWPGRGRALRRVGVGWFMVGFLPVSNLFLLNASVAEHWLYLPSIGFLLFLAGVGLDALPPLLRVRRTALALAILGTVAVGALGARTWYRAFDWTDELTFFRQTIADGGDVPRARAALAVAYGHQAIENKQAGADDQAIAVLRSVVSRYPKMLASRINLATALARRGGLDEARSILEAVAVDLAALTQAGDSRELVTTVKTLDVLSKDNPAWLAQRRSLLERGLQQHPDAWDLVHYAIQTLARENDASGALVLARHFTDAHWWHGPAQIVVGQLEADRGRSAAALAAWTQASRLDIHDAEAFSNAAALCLRNGNLDAAHTFQASALGRQPGSPRQHILFAQVLARQGNSTDAQFQVAAAHNLLTEERQDR